MRLRGLHKKKEDGARSIAAKEVERLRGLGETYTEPLSNGSLVWNHKGRFSWVKDGDEDPGLQQYLRDFDDSSLYWRREEIVFLLQQYPDTLGTLYNVLVPSSVSYEDFWKRYFYRCDEERLLILLENHKKRGSVRQKKKQPAKEEEPEEQPRRRLTRRTKSERTIRIRSLSRDRNSLRRPPMPRFGASRIDSESDTEQTSSEDNGDVVLDIDRLLLLQPCSHGGKNTFINTELKRTDVNQSIPAASAALGSSRAQVHGVAKTTPSLGMMALQSRGDEKDEEHKSVEGDVFSEEGAFAPIPIMPPRRVRSLNVQLTTVNEDWIKKGSRDISRRAPGDVKVIAKTNKKSDQKLERKASGDLRSKWGDLTGRWRSIRIHDRVEI